MHRTEVAGLRVPNRVGGHPALDFCNTWAGWDVAPEPRQEWLKTYDHLAVWSGHAELVGEPVSSCGNRAKVRAHAVRQKAGSTR